MADAKKSFSDFMRQAWDYAKEAGVGEKLREYAYAVEVAKADPIEAMHGHYCGPGCMHVDFLNADERERLKKRNGWTEWPSVVMERYQRASSR